MHEGHCLMVISEQHWYPSLRQIKGDHNKGGTRGGVEPYLWLVLVSSFVKQKSLDYRWKGTGDSKREWLCLLGGTAWNGG